MEKKHKIKTVQQQVILFMIKEASKPMIKHV